MARIKLELPGTYHFFTTFPVRITDVNYGGHVGNDAILAFMHEARMQYLQHHGYSEMNLGGASLIMGDVAIEYKAELFYGDVVKVYVTAFDFGRVSFDLAYKLVKENDEKLIALAKTGMVCFDYGQKKAVSVPDEVRLKLSAA